MYFNQPGYKSTTRNLDERLPYPHYSNDRFGHGKGESLIFDDGEKGEWTSYSDRFNLWDKEACKRARECVKGFPNGQRQVTGLYWKTWLEGYYNAPVQLHKIYACTDGGGYPIWCFNYDVDIAATLPTKTNEK